MNVISEHADVSNGLNYTHYFEGDVFPPTRSLQSAQYIFVFSVCLFAKIHSMVSGSMEIVKTKGFAMIGYWWRV